MVDTYDATLDPTQKTAADEEATESMRFEEALGELENVVKRMQDPSCSLDEALKLFARGSELTKLCHHKLEEVEAKVTLLTEDQEGQLQESEASDKLF